MKITRDDESGAVLLIGAVRYALKRNSYMSEVVIKELRKRLPECHDKALYVMERDIAEWLENRAEDKRCISYVHPDEWRAFLIDIRTERAKRKK